MATATTRSPGIRGGYVTYAGLTRLVPGTDYFSVGGSQTEGLFGVVNSGTVSGLWIYQTGEGRALNVLANGPQTSLGQMVIDSQTATTGGVLWVGTSTAGFANTTTGAGYFIVSNAAATGNVLMVRNAGLGTALNLKNDQNTLLLNLDGANTTGIVAYGTFPNLTSGNALSLATASASFSATDGLYKALVAHASSTGHAYYANMVGGGTGFRVDTSKGMGVDVQQNGTTQPGLRVFTAAQANNDALKIQAYNAASGTGQALSIYGGTNGGTLNVGIKDTGLVFIGDSTAPGSNPTAGGYLYVESGALKFRGSGGTVSTVAPA